MNLSWVEVARNAGFRHIRLLVRWSNHAAVTADATLDPVFAARVDTILNRIEAAGLSCVLDMHHYRQFDGDSVEANETAVAAGVVTTRAINIWSQIATRYLGRYPKMAYELYNEPHNVLDTSWNAIYPQIVSAIRAVDVARPMIVGPHWWNAASRLSAFTRPTDRNTIVTIHAYEPHSFTHQFAFGSQYQTTEFCCDLAQRAVITDNLDVAKNWSLANGYPIYVGEFGSYSAAPAASRVDYAGFLRSQMQSRGFAWAFFNFGLPSDWGIYDTVAGTWNTATRDVLIPPPAPAPPSPPPGPSGIVDSNIERLFGPLARSTVSNAGGTLEAFESLNAGSTGLTHEVTFVEVASSSGLFYVNFCGASSNARAASNGNSRPEANAQGYYCVVYRTGGTLADLGVEIWKVSGSSAARTFISATAITGAGASASAVVRVAVTGPNFTVTVTPSVGTPYSFTSTDTTYRGGWFGVSAWEKTIPNTMMWKTSYSI